MSNSLEMRGVVKCYGRRRALDGLDLDVQAGSIFGLIGSNGAGKTTAMAVSVGLLRTAAGSVNLLGEGPFRPERHRGRVALLPQDSRLPLHARVGELLRFYGRLQGLSEQDAARSAAAMLDWVHLSDRSGNAVRTLSHGMLRRLNIAQAFLGSPELVLLDEPLSGLDPREAARIRDYLKARSGGQTIVISSHNLRELEALCDRVAFIEKGRLVRTDAMEKVVRRHHRLTYHVVAGGELPVAALSAALPGATFEVGDEGGRVTVVFDDTQIRTDEVNAAVLPLLLKAQVGVLEIRRGSDLESEYLAITKPSPVPGTESPR
jgi:ABC-type multidrug transport system ATPase subunit